MKWCISAWILLTSIQVWSLEPVLISTDMQSHEAEIVRESLRHTLGIPIRLVAIEKREWPCRETDRRRVLHLCIQNAEMPFTVLYARTSTVNSAFTAFQEKKNESEK